MPTDLLALFLFIGASGTISGVIAWLLANWQAFADLGNTHPLIQQFAELVISAGMSLVSFELVSNVSPDAIAKYNPLWMAIATGINVILMKSTQAAHAWYANLLIKREWSNIVTAMSIVGDSNGAEVQAFLQARFPDYTPDAIRTLIALTNKRFVRLSTSAGAPDRIRTVYKAAEVVVGSPANIERPPLDGANE